jgi:hypothetical protein
MAPRRTEKRKNPGKSVEVRSSEVAGITKQLADLGLTPEFASVAEFLAIADDFVTKGISASGAVAVPGTHRRIVYTLSMQSHIVSRVTLAYDANV